MRLLWPMLSVWTIKKKYIQKRVNTDNIHNAQKKNGQKQRKPI